MRAALKRAATRKVEAPARHRTTVFKPASLDEEARTFEAVVATGAAVRMGSITQVLSFAPDAIDKRRLKTGLPLLDSHDRFSLGSVLGRATSWRVEGDRLIMKFAFADTANGRNAFDLVQQGIIDKLSIGYRIRDAKSKQATDGRTIETVTNWEPFEASLVSVPADIDATIRSETMKKPRKQGAPKRHESDLDVLERDDIIEERDIDHDDQRTDRETRSERRRIRELRDIAERGRIGADELNRAIDDGEEPDEFRDRAFEIMAERDKRAPTRPDRGIMVQDRTEEAGRFITDALAHRMAPELIKPGEGNPFAGMRIPDMAREYLSCGGVGTRGLTDSEIVARVLSGDGGGFGTRAAHTASDFPLLLQSAGERSLLARFAALPSPLKALSNERSARDFRSQSLIRPGEAPRLEKVAESGEITSGTMAEESSAYQVDTYAKIFALSRKALINDDLSAFADFMSAFAVSANATEGDLFYALLSANAFAGKTLGDGTALFHADHGNLAATGAALSIDTLGAARKAMRLQTDISGQGRAGVVPKYLLVGPALETLAEQLIATINAATVDDVNPFSGKLNLLVEDRYEGNGWWLFADPGNEAAFVHAYLDGRNGPQVEMREGWTVLGTEFRCILDFGCGVREYRAAYRNPGA